MFGRKRRFRRGRYGMRKRSFRRGRVARRRGRAGRRLSIGWRM